MNSQIFHFCLVALFSFGGIVVSYANDEIIHEEDIQSLISNVDLTPIREKFEELSENQKGILYSVTYTGRKLKMLNGKEAVAGCICKYFNFQFISLDRKTKCYINAEKVGKELRFDNLTSMTSQCVKTP